MATVDPFAGRAVVLGFQRGHPIAGFDELRGLDDPPIVVHTAGADGVERATIPDADDTSVVLQRGMADGETVLEWARSAGGRRTVVLERRDEVGAVARTYVVRGAWVVALDGLTAAKAGPLVTIERLVLEHEGWQLLEG